MIRTGFSRTLLAAAVAGGLFAGVVDTSSAEAWPSKPLRLIVPFPPGGAADTVGRTFAEKLSEVLKQPVVVENRDGAGTAIAADAAAKAAPDGYTLSLATTGQLTILPHLNKAITFDPFTSFAPVTNLASVSYAIGVGSETPIASVKELIENARQEPGKLSYSSCGSGTLCHLSGEFFKSLTGIDLLHVPFKGSAPAVSALLGNQVNLSFDTLTILAPQIRAGKVKGIVLTSKKRSSLAPDVPTAAEAGVPEFVVSSWFGLVVPAKTPRPIIERLHAELTRIAALPEVKEALNKRGLDVIPSTPAEFEKLIRDDYERWGKVVAASGAKVD